MPTTTTASATRCSPAPRRSSGTTGFLLTSPSSRRRGWPPDARTRLGIPRDHWTGVELTPPHVLVTDEHALDLGGRSVRDHRPRPRPHRHRRRRARSGCRRLDRRRRRRGLAAHDRFRVVPARLAARARRPDRAHGSPTSTVVPGHGAVVDRAFVHEQAHRLQAVADAISVGFAHREPVEYVAERAAGASRMPLEMVEPAIIRGYTQLAAS